MFAFALKCTSGFARTDGALSGIRTHTERCLRPRSLPVGVPGRNFLLGKGYRMKTHARTVGLCCGTGHRIARSGK